jgi:hypothetical protein
MPILPQQYVRSARSHWMHHTARMKPRPRRSSNLAAAIFFTANVSLSSYRVETLDVACVPALMSRPIDRISRLRIFQIARLTAKPVSDSGEPIDGPRVSGLPFRSPSIRTPKPARSNSTQLRPVSLLRLRSESPKWKGITALLDNPWISLMRHVPNMGRIETGTGVA